MKDKGFSNKQLQMSQDEIRTPYNQEDKPNETVLVKLNQVGNRSLVKGAGKTVSLDRVAGRPVVDIDPGERSFTQLTGKILQSSRPTHEERNCKESIEYYLQNTDTNTYEKPVGGSIALIEEIRGFPKQNVSPFNKQVRKLSKTDKNK